MVNSYSFDPNNHISPINNPALPQRGQNGNTPDGPVSAAESLLSAQPVSYGASLGTPATGEDKAEAHRLAAGTELSNARYKIERLVAAGGMGAVYRAIDTRFNRPCAVKEMLDEFKNESERAQAIEWFSREATLLLDLNHPCIPRVRDFFMEQGRHYLVMDFIEGSTMAELLERSSSVMGVNGARGVPEARARSWSQQLCNVLSYLHRLTPPIIFRDLKPSNIMVTERDEIKLIDFGIARTFQAQSQSTIIMTPGYAPPEQVQGLPEPRSDLYALGATIHKALTHHDASNNRPLFTFPPVRTLRPDVSVAFEQVLMKALALLPDARWSSAAEMERAILALPPITVVPPLSSAPGAGSPQPARPSGPSTPGSAPSATPGTPGAAAAASAAPSARNTTTGPAGVHILNALSHIAAGHFEAAYQPVQQAYALEPENSLVHKIFGIVFIHRQPAQVDLAMQAYNRSLQYNPNDAETHKLVGDILLYFRQNAEAAIPAYRRSLSLNVQDAEAHSRLGLCYEKTSQLDAALREYQEAVRLEPKQFQLQVVLGQLALRTNQLQLAENAFVQALFIRPAEHHVRFLLSQVYERENKLEDAYRECGYVVGPLGASNPAVPQMFQRLRSRLGR
jgi:serine/threonine protein kinase